MLAKDRSYDNSEVNMNVGDKEMLVRAIMRTHMIRIQPTPLSKGLGSNHKL